MARARSCAQRLLQISAEAGVPALVLLIWGLVTGVGHRAAFWLREKTPSALLIVFLVTSLFNYSLALPFSGLIFVTAFPLLAAKRELDGPKFVPQKHLLVPAALWCLLCVFMLSFGLSEFFEKQNRPALAARFCPLRAEAWYAVAMEKLKKNQPALREIDRALLWNNQDSFVWHRRALVLANSQPLNKEQIDRSFARAQELSPAHAPFYLEEGFYRLQTAEDGAAYELFKKAAELEPNAPVPHYALAMVYSRKKDLASARAELDTALLLKKRQLR